MKAKLTSQNRDGLKLRKQSSDVWGSIRVFLLLGRPVMHPRFLGSMDNYIWGYFAPWDGFYIGEFFVLF